MASSIVINILGNAQNFIGATNNATNAVDKWAARAGKAGAGIAAALGAGATAAVKSAADQSAAISAWTQVTKQQMTEQHKTTARSLNLSQTDYAKHYTMLSSLYQSNGISQRKANKMAAAGLKMAADQAAFGNTTVGEAVEAQAGLLKGSGELLEKYAISITAADVAAQMKAEGTDKLTGAELKAATAETKMMLIRKQAAKFTGQAAREANSLESRQQKLTATIEDFKAKLGSQLLPIVEQFIGKLQSAAEWVAANETKTKIVVGVLAGFAGVLLTVAGAIKVVRAVQAAWNAIMIATNVIMFANPIVLVVAGLVALGAALVIAYKKSETFRNIVNGVWDAVKKAFGAMWDFMRFNAAKGVQFVFGIYHKFADGVLGVIEGLLRGAGKLPKWLGGGKFDDAANAVAKIRGGLDAMKRKLDELPTEKTITFRSNANEIAGSIRALDRAARAAGVETSGVTSSRGGGSQQGRFGGMRAGGGPVTKGMTYLVGEKGPELFTAQTSGRIIPADALRGKPGDRASAAAEAGITRMIEKMQKAVAKAKEISSAIRDTYRSFADITSLEPGPGFVNSLKAQADHAEAFARGITDLRAKGLNKTTLDQLVAKGPEQGLAMVEQLLNGGGIKEANSAVKRILAAGRGLGTREAVAKTGMRPDAELRALIKQGKQKQVIELDFAAGADELTDAIIKVLRKKIRTTAGGNVQVALGTGR